MTKLFSVKDIQADAFNAPFTLLQKGQALRGFADAVNGKDSGISAHPEDYVLYELGSFDEVSGLITAYEAPLRLVIGSELKEQK